METQKYDYGMIGLGTMGRNLAYNMNDHGFSVAGYDTDMAKVDAFEQEEAKRKLFGARDLKSFIAALKTPRVVILLVPAGHAVDAVIGELKPLLSDQDLIMDCGNSHFTDTDQRIDRLAKDNIHFMGVGVSGGEEGARFGPSIMPGGAKEAYQHVAPMLQAVAAKVKDEPCVTWLGPRSAGHYVKMVHNGIEYAIMQLISEAYHLLKEQAGMSNKELHQVFADWNEGPLKSYLIEITADIFAQKDDLTGNMLIDMILDRAQQKGTGQWTSQSAMDLGVPIPLIDEAVSARDISALKPERVEAGKKLKWDKAAKLSGKEELTAWLQDALNFSMIIAYAQGMYLLQHASKEYNYGLKMDEVATIWRGGCIIRAAMLDDIRAAYKKEPGLINLMLNDSFANKLVLMQDAARQVVKTAVDAGIPAPAMMAALSYYDSYRRGWLPANLLQAQRDFFGAHTYQRTDRDGIFHTHWDQKAN